MVASNIHRLGWKDGEESTIDRSDFGGNWKIYRPGGFKCWNILSRRYEINTMGS
jgi:hypothetical protein